MSTESWPPSMLTPSVTQVLISHGMRHSQVADSVKEFLSALQQQCRRLYFALSISIQQKPDGQIDVIAHTTLPLEEVSALIANTELPFLDCTRNVSIVPAQNLMNTNVVLQQLWISRQSGGSHGN